MTPAESLPAEPLPAEPLAAEPQPAESLPAEPLPAESLPAEPLPAESLPAEPLPAEPLAAGSPLARKLLDGYQRGFPLVERPYAAIGEEIGASEAAVIDAVEHLLEERAISRVGAVFEPGRAGASTLAAMAVPEADLEAVAALVGSFPDVNHSYRREHRLNLWFVLTSPDRARVEAVLDGLRAKTGLEILDLPMEEPFHLDLGFALRWPEDDSAEGSDAWGRRDAGAPGRLEGGQPEACDPGLPDPTNGVGAPASLRLPLGKADRRILAALQDGLQPVPRPFQALGERAGVPEGAVIALLKRLVGGGLIRRMGLVVRHREMGYHHNAMVVFDVPDEAVGSKGRAVAASGLATLCYRRSRRMPQWPFNLYLMVHAKSRPEALSAIGIIREQCALADFPHEILFGTRRFKQQGARYFDADT